MIKLALISITILFLVITGISLFIPSHVRISKIAELRIDSTTLWNNIDDLRQWEKWNPFFRNFGEKKVIYLDTANGIWNALQVESTTVRKKGIIDGDHVMEMQNGQRSPVICGWRCAVNTEKPGTVTLQWYMDFKLGWLPWHKFGSLLYEKKYGTIMEAGLANLKYILEK